MGAAPVVAELPVVAGSEVAAGETPAGAGLEAATSPAVEPRVPVAEPPADPVATVNALIERAVARCRESLAALRTVRGAPVDDEEIEEASERFGADLRAALDFATAGAPTGDGEVDAARASVTGALAPTTAIWGPVIGWLSAEAFRSVLAPDPVERGGSAWFDSLAMGRVLADACRWRGLDEGASWWAVETTRQLLRRPGVAAFDGPADGRAARLVRAWFADEDLGRWLGMNRHEGIGYVNREAFEAALRWLTVLVAIRRGSDDPEPLVEAYELAVTLTDAAAASGYQVGRIIARAAL